PWYDDVNPWTPAYPDLPWRYEYPLPALCLVPLAVKPRPAYLPVWRPRPMRFRAKTASGVYTLLGDDPAPILTSVTTRLSRRWSRPWQRSSPTLLHPVTCRTPRKAEMPTPTTADDIVNQA